MTKLEKRFERDIVNNYTTAKIERVYNANRIPQMISTKGGLDAARQLISKDGGTDGLTSLYLRNRLDLSIEASVLKDEYRELFTDEERKLCKERLLQFGYIVL